MVRKVTMANYHYRVKYQWGKEFRDVSNDVPLRGGLPYGIPLRGSRNQPGFGAPKPGAPKSTGAIMSKECRLTGESTEWDI